MWSNNTGGAKIEGGQIELLILNGHENIDPNIFFKIKTGKITRGHAFMLLKGLSRFRKYCFSQRTLNEWNKLPANCVHSSMLICLTTYSKDHYLVRAGYT